MAFPINEILASLNNANLATKQPALYQVIKQLINAARDTQLGVTTAVTVVNQQLTNSMTYGTSADRGNYKPQITAGNLVFFFESDTQSLWVFADGTWYQATGAPSDLTFLTATDETALLPNSRELVAGTNVTFDDTTPGQRVIDVSSSSTPGGADKSIQYNNAGVFGGIAPTTAGYVLASNGPGATPSFQSVGSVGGGNAIDSTAYGSEPASPSTGDVDLYTDSLYLSRWNGTIWEVWGPLRKMVKPDDSAFSWVNQGSATVSSANGSVYLDAPAAVNPNYRMRVKAIPSTPYTITACIQVLHGRQDFGVAGLCFYDTSNPVIGFGFDSSGQLIVQQMTSPSAFNSTPAQRDCYRLGLTGYCAWLRLTDDGTNLGFYYSNDGINFRLFRTQTRASFMTPNRYGYFASANDANYGSSINVLSLEEA